MGPLFHLAPPNDATRICLTDREQKSFPHSGCSPESSPNGGCPRQEGAKRWGFKHVAKIERREDAKCAKYAKVLHFSAYSACSAFWILFLGGIGIGVSWLATRRV